MALIVADHDGNDAQGADTCEAAAGADTGHNTAADEASEMIKILSRHRRLSSQAEPAPRDPTRPRARDALVIPHFSFRVDRRWILNVL